MLNRGYIMMAYGELFSLQPTYFSSERDSFMADSYVTYGAKLDSEAVTRTLEHIFRTNLANEEASLRENPKGQSKRPTPICIWGLHGIGKTAIVKTFAADNGWKFRYCAPAQFEEMGDLHGLPVRKGSEIDKGAL